MKKRLLINYEDIISLDNLLLAWQEFVKGKKSKLDVLNFSFNMIDNILQLHDDLINKTYRHGGYESFYVTDPKLRHIHKAGARDRLLHHAIHRALYSFFDKTFIADSFSCRLDKGSHRAVRRFRVFARKASRNHTKTVWVLKCDIKKFFASIDHTILLNVLNENIVDKNILDLLAKIIESFEINQGKGLPLGNLTSQLFANIYMDIFDQFVKHKIKAKYYVRYADDFIILSDDTIWLMDVLQTIERFLHNELKLELHPQKVLIKTVASGVDFLGWVNFPWHIVLRTKTKKRMLNRLEKNINSQSLASYLGFLKHGNAYKLKREILSKF